MSSSSPLPISVEFFPPKTTEGSSKLRAVRQQLYALKPQFCPSLLAPVVPLKRARSAL